MTDGAALKALKAKWTRLAPREQTPVRATGALVLLALLWWLLLAPPLKALRQSAARHAEVNAQWQQMQQMQAEAEQLQNAPKHASADAPAQLRGMTETQLGPAARLTIAAGQATVTLTEAPAAAVAAWLAQVMAGTQATPVQAQLTRAGNTQPPRWSGTLVLVLPTP